MNVTRYPKAAWRGEDLPNVGGTLVSPRLIVVHVMQGTLAGTDSWFHNPAAQVSAHFGVGKEGQVYQWVDLNRVAWAEMNYNDAAWSIEHEGMSGEKLTPAQLASSVGLIRWLGREIDLERGLPLGTAAQRTNVPSGTGVIGHGELGVPGGNHPNCPGSPILDQMNIALRDTAKSTVREAVDHAVTPARSAVEKASTTVKKEASTMDVKELIPTKAQLASIGAEAGALAVYINDFVNYAHPTGKELIALNAGATVVLAISHTINKLVSKAQSKSTKKAAAAATVATPTS